MTDLSPAAQAVLDAWDSVLDPEVTCLTRDPERQALAAALRAAADQVVPIRLIDEPDFSPSSCCERVLREERAEIRAKLLTIAAELDQ